MAQRTLYGELYKTFFHLSLRIRDLNVRVRTLEKLCAELHPIVEASLNSNDYSNDTWDKITIKRSDNTKVLEIEFLYRTRISGFSPNKGLVNGFTKKYYNLSGALVLTETYVVDTLNVNNLSNYYKSDGYKPKSFNYSSVPSGPYY